MSLLSNASSWIPLEDKNTKKKPAMFQTYQRITQEETPFSTDSTNSENQERVQRIESILQKMNQVDSSPELTNYTPPPLSLQELSNVNEPFSLNQNLISGLSLPGLSNPGLSTSNGSSYKRVYEPVPYVEPPGHLGLENNSKLMEKLNYMIHLLEQQQHESTQYIWEEFLLYGLLGVFMIYLVDSFARAGKYIR
jgi:hypothetical protein